MINGGYMHKFLWVDLTNRVCRFVRPDDELLSNFLGGYGIAARLYYDLMIPGIDPLGPENILGFTTGPLTGSSAPTGTRWTVTCKSPLTGGWGDANCGGFFGSAIKASGYDAIFITGKSSKPIYLYIENEKIEFRDATQMWGMDCYQVDDWIKSNVGKDTEIACIGQAGEKLSLISAIVHAKGRAAARSGVGAVMGSKLLKALVIRGNIPIPVADQSRVDAVKSKYTRQINDGTGYSDFYRTTGTPGYTVDSIYLGDSPTKNWELSVAHNPSSDPLKFEELLKVRKSRKSCWRCPISCWGTVAIKDQTNLLEAHQPEYETEAAFGSNLLNNNLLSIIKANDSCNRYGLDTISAGACIAFAFECFERGLISVADTGGLELHWGDPFAINKMLEKLAMREDFGNVIADGVMRASQTIGPKSTPYAIHAGGQELAMHDPRFEPAMAVIYKMDATPGRHTQATQYLVPTGYKSDRPGYGVDRAQQKGRGFWVKEFACLNHTMNASGICFFGYLSTTVDFVAEFISSVVGCDFSVNDMLIIGERIGNIRQSFNVREGINSLLQPDPWRAYGNPPLVDGPTAYVKVELDMLVHEFLDEMDWTIDTAVPNREILEKLGLVDIADDLWPI